MRAWSSTTEQSPSSPWGWGKASGKGVPPKKLCLVPGGSCLRRSPAWLQGAAGAWHGIQVVASLCGGPVLSHCGFLCVLWFRPQKWVHPQPSLLHGGRNLERSLGLPAKVTLTGLTQVLCGYFYPMAVPSRLPTWLRFTSAPTHLCGAEVVLLVVPPAAPASALPSTATTGQGLSSPRAAWGLTLVRHGLNCQVSAPVG